HGPRPRRAGELRSQAGERGRPARVSVRRGAATPGDEPVTADAIELSELEHDALTELVNIGVSRAASSLRTMVGRQVLLSVPSVEVVSRVTATALIRE